MKRYRCICDRRTFTRLGLWWHDLWRGALR